MTNPRRFIPDYDTGERIGALEARHWMNDVAQFATRFTAGFTERSTAAFAKPPDTASRVGRTRAGTVAQAGQRAFRLDRNRIESAAREVD